MTFLPLTASLFLAWLTPSIEVQAAVPEAAISQFVTSELDRQHVPGASLALFQDGKVVFAKGFGLSNVELQTPATPQTVYLLGSVSKQLLAAGILLLQADNKIKLDDEIRSIRPALPESWKGITIRHLLSHTAGLPRELPGWNGDTPFSQADLDAMILKTVPVSAPSEKYSYSNAGYFTIASLISQLSGKPWPEFMKERLFKPLGMNATRETTWKDVVPNRAYGYAYSQGNWTNDRYLASVRPSGAFLSTVMDMGKWEAELLNPKVLPPDAPKLMFAPTKLLSGVSQYGLGFNIGSHLGRKLISHNGSTMSFKSSYLRYVDSKQAVIVLMNGSPSNPDVVAKGVAELWLGPKQPTRYYPAFVQAAL